MGERGPALLKCVRQGVENHFQGALVGELLTDDQLVVKCCVDQSFANVDGYLVLICFDYGELM